MVKALVEGRAPDPDEAGMATPQWAMDRAAELAGQMINRIEASGVHIVGDLAVLRQQLTGPQDATDDAADLPVDSAIAAMLGALQGSTSPGPGASRRPAASWVHRARTLLGVKKTP